MRHSISDPGWKKMSYHLYSLRAAIAVHTRSRTNRFSNLPRVSAAAMPTSSRHKPQLGFRTRNTAPTEQKGIYFVQRIFIYIYSYAERSTHVRCKIRYFVVSRKYHSINDSVDIDFHFIFLSWYFSIVSALCCCIKYTIFPCTSIHVFNIFI